MIYQNALNQLKDRGFADNSIDGAHRTGRMIFKKAVEMQLIKLDPSDHAVVPKRQKTLEELEREDKVAKYLEKDEFNTFLKTCKELGLLFDYTIFMMLAYIGMRAGELCALKWSDIDFEEKTKTIYNPTNNISKYTLLTPKTSSSVRLIEIDDILIGVLEAHKKEVSEIKMQYRMTYHDKDFVILKTS